MEEVWFMAPRRTWPISWTVAMAEGVVVESKSPAYRKLLPWSCMKTEGCADFSSFFFSSVHVHWPGVPLVTQSDHGWEMYVVANIHTNICHTLDPSLSETLQHRWCFNKSNVKPEILWMVLRCYFTPGFEDIFDHGVNNGWYDINDPVEKCFSCPIFLSYV